MINDDIAFKHRTNHYMYQKGIIRKILFSIHSKFKLLKVYFDPEKRIFLYSNCQCPFFKYLNKRLPVLHSEMLSLNTIVPKVLVVILVPLYEEEVPSAHHDRETSPLRWVVYDFKVPLGFYFVT